MTNRTAWTGGNLNSGLGWVTAINSADMASMINGNTVLSSVADFANGTALDQLMDVSVRCAISSSTTVAGANFAIWIYDLLDNGSTYGDGQLTSGTSTAKTPTFAPAAVIPLVVAASQTTLVGFANGIVLPPGSFRLAFQNNSGFTLTSGTQTVMMRSYNVQLNN